MPKQNAKLNILDFYLSRQS